MNSDLGEFYVAAEVVGVEDGFAAAQTVPLKVAICCAVASPDVKRQAHQGGAAQVVECQPMNFDPAARFRPFPSITPRLILASQA